MNEHKESMNDKTKATVNKRTFIIFVVIIAAVLLISQINPIMDVVDDIMNMMFPMILGVVLAYVVNPFTVVMERQFYKWFKLKREKSRRRFAHGMAVVCSLITLLLVIVLLIFFNSNTGVLFIS